MSTGYHVQLYKSLGATGRISLTPFFRTLWEHGLGFGPYPLSQPLTWEQALQESSALFHEQELRTLPLAESIQLLEQHGGSLGLYDKQVPYDCQIEWTMSPAQRSVLSVSFGQSAGWPTRISGTGRQDPETYLLSDYQQGMASFVHWSAVCCQWFQPELAVSYEGDGGEFIAPESLIAHVDTQTIPDWGSSEWGWLMFLPTQRLTSDLLTTLLKTPFLTMQPLPPAGLLVYQLPSRYRYETRAANALIAEAQAQSQQSTRQLTDKEAAEIFRHWQAEVRAYQRAITLFHSAQDARGESMARLRIQQIETTIDQYKNRHPHQGTPERREE